MKIKTKLTTLFCVSMLIMSGAFTTNLMLTEKTVISAEEQNVYDKVEVLLKDNLVGQIDTETKSMVSFYKQTNLEHIKGELSLELSGFRKTIEGIYKNSPSVAEAELRIYSFINEYRWNNGRYIFAYDAKTGVGKANGGVPSCIGEASLDKQDINGVHYARHIIGSAKSDPVGFTSYHFKNPVTNKVEEKLTASFYFEELNLVVATGEYLSALKKDNIDAAKQVISTAKYGKSGYFWIQDKNGKVLAHPDSSLVGSEIPLTTVKIANELRGKPDAFVKVAFKNPATGRRENKIVYARQIFPEWGWTIATGAYESDVATIQEGLTSATAEIFREKVFVSNLTVVGLLVASLFVAMVMLNKIVHELVTLKEKIDTLSTGEADLTSRIDVSSKDELGDIGHSVNNFVKYLQSMILEISQASNHITEAIKQLTFQSERNSQALISHETETEQVVAAIEQMSSAAVTAAQSATETAANTQKANDDALASKEGVLGATSSMATLLKEVGTASLRINEMSENTQEIVKALGVIGDVADQINLLALNAAIEAARAGEHGRGFTVVADEVRALAVKTQSSTSEITQILETLSEGAESAVTAMEATKGSCKLTSENTEQVADNLDAMTSSIAGINELTSQIAIASEEQSSVTEEVSRNMVNIREMVSELTQNGQATVDSTQNLAVANTQLSELVAKFKLQ